MLHVGHRLSTNIGLRLPSKNKIVQNLVSNYIPTVIATSIEPMWVLINRLFCMLQPLEELQRARALGIRSVGLNYSNLPPQLSILKALKHGHLVLACVCVMALLANLLATASAGLFFPKAYFLPHPTKFTPPFEAKFAPMDLDLDLENVFSSDISTRYIDDQGESHFFVAESNYTQHTNLPPWIDDNTMYLPIFDEKEPLWRSNRDSYRARTKAFRGEANCKPLTMDVDYRIWKTTDDEDEQDLPPRVNITAGKTVKCYADSHIGPLTGPCVTGKVAGEFASPLKAEYNKTKSSNEENREVCMSAALLGWLRGTIDGCEKNRSYSIVTPDRTPKLAPTPQNTLLISCQPSIIIGDAFITVDYTGRLILPATDFTPDADQSPQALQQYFPSGKANLIAGSNIAIFKTLFSEWHNDSYSGEYLQHFVNRKSQSLRFTDPNLPVPQYSDLEQPLSRAYSKLFATWLGTNKNTLFVRTSATSEKVPGEILAEEERISINTTLFVITEIILGIYIVAAILVYARRPGQYLPRMPTSVAAVISLFSASAAVEDFKGTSQFTTKERDAFLKNSGIRYGYGSYLGSDGSVHVGIEKVPYVTRRKGTAFTNADFGYVGKKRVLESETSTRVGTEFEKSEKKGMGSFWARLNGGSRRG